MRWRGRGWQRTGASMRASAWRIGEGFARLMEALVNGNGDGTCWLKGGSQEEDDAAAEAGEWGPPGSEMRAAVRRPSDFPTRSGRPILISRLVACERRGRVGTVRFNRMVSERGGASGLRARNGLRGMGRAKGEEERAERIRPEGLRELERFLIK